MGLREDSGILLVQVPHAPSALIRSQGIRPVRVGSNDLHVAEPPETPLTTNQKVPRNTSET